MDFSFSDPEQQFADSMRRYAHDRLRPEYASYDRGTKYPRERLRELADLGITGLRVPAEYGGAEASYVMGGIAAEEIARRVYSSLGERLSQRGSITFDGVRVPAENRLGDESGGFIQAMSAFDYNRAIIALCCVGAAQQSLDETIEYAKQRYTFGKPIAKHEGVSFQIAEHLTMLSAARLLAYQCLALRD